MEFNTIYRNGKPERFFIKIEKPEEFNFIQPYFLVTSFERPRKGNILEMNCLFSGSVWQGRQRHGYGYSCSADVYGTLIEIIFQLYGKKLTDFARDELREINTHNDKLVLSDMTLSELSDLNNQTITARFNH